MEEEVLFKIDIPKESITSIENLTKANKALREERKKLDLQSAEGQKRAQQINSQLDSNTDLIKKNSSALEKQRLNVGNYTGALDKMVPGLGATANGFSAMKTSALAFIATPIGAVIAALGLALAALTSYFKGSEEGQTKLNRIMDIGSAVMGKFSDLVQFLGGTLFKALAKGFETIIGFLDKWVPGFKEATEALGKFLNLDVAEHISNLEEERVALNRLLITERGRLKAEIEAAKLRAESTKDAKLRSAALAEVEAKTNELFNQELKLAQLERDIAIEKGKLANNTIEDNDKIAESIAKVDDIERQRSAALKENATKLVAIREQEKAANQKKIDDLRKLDEVESEIARNKRLRELEASLEMDALTLEQKAAQDAQIIALDENKAAKMMANTSKALAASIKAGEKENEEAKKQAEIHKIIQEGKIQATMSFFRLLGGLAREGTIVAKVAGVAQATIDTYVAATKALTAGPFIGPILAAITVATGLANVAKITGVAGFFNGGLVEGYATGGLSGTKIMGHHGRPIRRSNGDNLLATVKTGEVILNERQQAMLGGEATFRRMGVPGFATGGASGFSVSQAAQSSEAASSSRAFINAVSQMKFFVSVAEMRQGINDVQVVEDRAQVI